MFAVVLFLVVGELASGTNVYFVSMMAIAVVSACVTYNFLGGFRTISGIAFTSFALGSLVISQIGKVVLFERADENLDVPQVTITVYAVYFASLMLGTFVFSRLRFPLPRPAEPETPTQSKYLYFVSLTGGLIGSAGEMAMDLAQGSQSTSLTHAYARALAYLLPFSLVLAVDNRIRSTNGRHCFGWLALWPTLAIMVEGFVISSRLSFLEPVGIVFLTCYLRSFTFRKSHRVAGIVAVTFFFVILSPYYLYSRGWRGDGTIRGQASTMLNVLESAPDQWASIKAIVGNAALETPGTVNYFATPGAVTVNRFAKIGPDSTLINACATGFHYGFTSIGLDLATQVPRFLYPNKPEFGSNPYLGHLDGQESDTFETTNSTVTSVADSYGAFSWFGAVVFPFVVMPLVFVVNESMFDITRPWGTVAVVLLILGISEGSMGADVVVSMIKNPLYVIIISWCAMWVVRIIPAMGDRAVRLRTGDTEAVSTDALGPSIV
jgi:hypothetical protein